MPRFGKPPHGRHDAQQAPVETHAALPDIGHLPGMQQVVARLIEQAITNAAAQHHAQHARKQNILYVPNLPMAQA